MPHVLFVEPVADAQRPFIRALKRVGARVTGIGSDRPATLDAELRHLLDGYVHVADPADPDQLTEAVKRIQDRGPWVDRLETTTEAFLVSTALAREATSIPGETAATVALTRDKWACRKALREAGVHTLPDTPVTTLAEARSFAERVGFPLMLKPRIGAGQAQLRRLDDDAALESALAGLQNPSDHVLERFVAGHEGFFDSLVVKGEVVYEAATHFYPPVLEAMADRSVSPVMVHTNRLAQDGYDEHRHVNRTAIAALGLGTTATHLEWFSSAAGMWASEMGLHPPPCALWDLFSEAGDFDLYTEWARAIVYGVVERRGQSWLAAGLINLRPDRDGVISRYEGVEAMQRRYGSLIFRMHLPPPGTPTQPIDGGYLTNAYLCLKHRDYDELRAILADIGHRVRVYAS